jgi:hypothetical protein
MTVISPDRASIEHVPMRDLFTTNLCFGGPIGAPLTSRCPTPVAWWPSTGPAPALP